MNIIHTPVLLAECLELLGPRGETGTFIDATLGEGGHTFGFLSRFPGLTVIGIDADAEIQKTARERLKEFSGRVQFVTGWSHDFFAGYALPARPDTILIDLGVSLFHYEKSGRGFSFNRDERLDMRIDCGSGQSAADLVAHLSEKALADLLYQNAEERFSRRIARGIVEARAEAPITSTAVLAGIVARAVPPQYRRGPVHAATKTFQALRIAVNGELSRLEGLLESALRVLKPGGRMGVISFHSLEDRIVKNFFRNKGKDCTCPPESPICLCEGKRIVNILTKKGVAPGQDEILANPPSRSARLRVIEKVKEG